MAITFTVELSEEEAEAYAQFLKRVGVSDYQTNAANEEEAYKMLDAGEKIRNALAETGFNPR